MKFGLIINVGNYNSLRCESSDHPTLLECYEECLFIVEGWDDYDAVEYWKNKLIKRILELKKILEPKEETDDHQTIGQMMVDNAFSGGND